MSKLKNDTPSSVSASPTFESGTLLHLKPELSRRQLLGSMVTSSSYTLLPLATVAVSPLQAQESLPILTNIEQETLSAFTDRLIPADENGPGALAAGVVDYINRALANWLSNEQGAIKLNLQQINSFAIDRFNDNFAELTVEQQELLMTSMETNQVASFNNAQQVFNRLRRLTLEGMFSDPYYGGNQGYVGWDLIAYPGAVMASSPEMQAMGGRLAPLHTSAYGADYDGD